MKHLFLFLCLLLTLNNFAYAELLPIDSVPAQGAELEMWHNISDKGDFDVDRMNALGRLASEALNTGFCLSNKIIPEGLLLKSLQAYLVASHSSGILTTLHNYGKIRIHEMAGMHEPQFVLRSGRKNAFRESLFSELGVDDYETAPVKAAPLLTYIHGVGANLLWPSDDLDVVQTSIELEQYRNSVLFAHNTTIQTLIYADAFNREQYFAESMTEKFRSGRAYFLDAIPFLMGQFALLDFPKFSNTLRKSADLDMYLALLETQGIRTTRSNMRTVQIAKLCSYSVWTSGGLLVDFLLSRERRFNSFFRSLGILPIGNWRVQWWPDVYSYLSIYGPTLKVATNCYTPYGVFDFAYETNAFFQHGVRNYHEETFGWKKNVGKLFLPLGTLVVRLQYTSNFQHGMWMESEVMIRLIPAISVGIQHYWGYGESFLRSRKGHSFSFKESWESGFKVFFKIEIPF